MRLHDLKLLGRQAPGFIQYGVRDGDFAYVVHDGGQRNLVNLFAGQAVPQLGFAQKKRCDVADAPDMAARFAAAKLDGCGKRLNHADAEVDDLPGLLKQTGLLVFDHAAQAFSGLVQLDDRVDPALDHIRNDRLADHINDAQVIGEPGDLAACLSSDEKYRYLRQQTVFGKASEQLDAVHDGHDDVE